MGLRNVPWILIIPGRLSPWSRFGHFAALFAILGHMFPVWLKFREERALLRRWDLSSCSLPSLLLIAVGVFVAVVLVFRYVSLGSIVAVVFFPSSHGCCTTTTDAPQVLVLMAIASVLIIAKHHQNIRRLLAGTEPRFQLEAGQTAMSRIAIIGAGAWGTGLAIVLGRRGGHQVRLWAHEKEVRDSISTRRINELFLPGQSIPENVSATGSLQEALDGAEIVVSVMPSQHCRPLFQQMRPDLKPEMLFVSATKGLEEKTLLRMTEVVPAGHRIGKRLLRRASARSVVRHSPRKLRAAILLPSPSLRKDVELAETVQREFSDPRFRVYTNDDVAGVELGGALKNVIAIAAGVCDGLGLGHNSVAALITRGLAEMTRLAVACGGRQETMAGLAGLGDLVLTCTGGLSRNRSVGVELGRGRKLADIIAGMHGAVAEGVFTTQAAVGLARARGVEMPIIDQMDAILHRDKPPAEAITDLMTRSAKSEIATSALSQLLASGCAGTCISGLDRITPQLGPKRQSSLAGRSINHPNSRSAEPCRLSRNAQVLW